MSEETFVLQVEQIRQEAPRVKTLRLRADQGILPFDFRPGMHLGVRPLGPDEQGPEDSEQWVHFSLSSSPAEKQFMEITVLNQGQASAVVHQLSPGDLMEVTRPEGRFLLEEPITDHGPVFFAAGIGVAPVRSMIRYCLDMEIGNRISLFASYSTPEQALFLDQFKDWANEVPRFSVWENFTKPEARSAGEDYPHHRGSWKRPYLEERLRQPLERTYYLCLPRAFREKVESLLASLGIPAELIRKEQW